MRCRRIAARCIGLSSGCPAAAISGGGRFRRHGEALLQRSLGALSLRSAGASSAARSCPGFSDHTSTVGHCRPKADTGPTLAAPALPGVNRPQRPGAPRPHLGAHAPGHNDTDRCNDRGWHRAWDWRRPQGALTSPQGDFKGPPIRATSGRPSKGFVGQACAGRSCARRARMQHFVGSSEHDSGLSPRRGSGVQPPELTTGMSPSDNLVSEMAHATPTCSRNSPGCGACAMSASAPRQRHEVLCMRHAAVVVGGNPCYGARWSAAPRCLGNEFKGCGQRGSASA